jgi:hypothetical protein
MDPVVHKLRGRRFAIEEGKIRIFGAECNIDGTGWLTDHDSRPIINSYTPISQRIIAEVLRPNTFRGKCVKGILISAKVAVALFCEGIITQYHLINCRETDNKIVLTGVKIGDRSYTVVIKRRDQIANDIEAVNRLRLVA